MNKKSFQKSSYWIFQINIKKKAYKGGTSKKVNILKENIKDRKEKNCRAKYLMELQELLQPFLEKVKNPVSIEIECTADIFTCIYLILNLIFILSYYLIANVIANDPGSSTNVFTLDPIMRIHYHDFTR